MGKRMYVIENKKIKTISLFNQKLDLNKQWNVFYVCNESKPNYTIKLFNELKTIVIDNNACNLNAKIDIMVYKIKRTASINDLLASVEMDINITDINIKNINILIVFGLELYINLNDQRNIRKNLENVYPNTQFIVTTQSPFVLSTFTNDEIFLINPKKGKEDIYQPSFNPINESITTILELLMEVPLREESFDKLLNEYFNAINNLNIDKVFEIEKIFDQMVIDKRLGKNNTILFKSNSMKSRLELLGKVKWL